MSKKLIKIVAAIGAGTSGLYWGALPALAVNLCDTSGGPNVSNLCGGTIEGLVKTVINTALFIAFIAALVFLIWGGIKWIMSGSGDKEALPKAKETVTAALIGLAVVLGSWVLLNIVIQFFIPGASITNLTTPTLLLK